MIKHILSMYICWFIRKCEVGTSSAARSQRLRGIISRKHYFPKPLVAAVAAAVTTAQAAATAIWVVVAVAAAAAAAAAVSVVVVVVVVVVLNVNRQFTKFPSAANERAKFFAYLC
jgi:hypothetical protein